MEKEILRSLCSGIKGSNPSVEEVSKELEKISDRGRSYWDAFSPLVSAVQVDRKDLIKLMIEDFGFDVDSFGATTDSALITALQDGNRDLVRFLVVQMKAKVNINFYRRRWLTPLINVLGTHYNSKMVKLLIEELGADVNFKASKNEDGSNPYLALHWVIWWEMV